MICGHCKENHTTVGEVRVCAQIVNLPPKPATVQVTEPGMYKIPGGSIYDNVFQVVFNKAKTHLYAKKLVATYDACNELHRVDFDYDKGSIFKLSAENRMTVAEVAELGKLTGRCWVCRRELNTAKSIAAGIGPVCIKKV